MKTPNEFRELAKKCMPQMLQMYSPAVAARVIAIHFFISLVDDPGGFGPTLSKDSTLLCCHDHNPDYWIKAWEDITGFRFYILTDYNHLKFMKPVPQRNGPTIDGHVHDSDFNTFWKKVINLMCKVFHVEIIFPDVKILQTPLEWLDSK